MRLFNKLNNYINDSEYRVIIGNNYVNIVNYIKILDFTSSIIRVENKYGKTIVNGSNLVISKMLDDEILIVGNINNISVEGNNG